MKLTACSIVFLILLSPCANHNKKILVVMKGGGTADADSKTIVLKDGGGTEEKTIQLNSADKITLTIQKEDGKSTVDISDDGYYLLNGKNDTIIGSFQKYGVPTGSYTTVSQDALKRDIDSLQLLITNNNVSPANRNYFILPYQAAKITNNLEAFMVTPYHRMTSIEKVGDKDPEVYRFWSIKEVRETLEKLKAMTVSKD